MLVCAPKAQMKMRAWAHLQSIRSFVKRNLNRIAYLGGIVEQIPQGGYLITNPYAKQATNINKNNWVNWYLSVLV
jgi:hypothetical protein